MNPLSRFGLSAAALLGIDLARGPDHVGRFRPWAGSYVPPSAPKATKDRSAIKAARKQSRKNRSKK